MYRLNHNRCTQDDDMDEDTNYPFASYINGFVDGLKYASSEEDNSNNSTADRVVPPVTDKVVAPPVADKIVAPPVADKIVAPPVADKVVAPPVADKVVAPPAVENFVNNAKNLIEKFKAEKLESDNKENILNVNKNVENFESGSNNGPTTTPNPVVTTTSGSRKDNNKTYLWIMLVFLIGLLIYIIKISTNPVTGV